jgi:hypothetical protein
MLRSLFACFLLLLAACSPEKMPRYSTLQALRVLGLTLQSQGGNAAETSFNGTTFSPGIMEVTPVISDLHGGGRSLSFNLYYCLDPGIGLGAPPTCAGNASRVDFLSNQPLAQPTGDYATPNFTGSLTPIPINLNTATASVLPVYAARYAALTPMERFNGVSILVFFEIFPTLDSAEKVTTFKRLFISEGRTLNQNPVNAGIDITREDGSPLLPLPTTETFLKAVIPASDFETYSVMDSAGNLVTQTEGVEMAWFLTGPADIECSNDKDCTPDGFLALPRTLAGELNRFTPPKVPTPTDRSRILIGIAKDSRGGNTVRRFEQTP